MAAMTTPLFLLELQGYGYLYDEIENSFRGISPIHQYFWKYGPVVGGNRKLWFSFFTDFDAF